MTALQERIKRHEGLRLKPYKDSLGYWTIGYGHLMTAKEKIAFADGITKEQAEELFKRISTSTPRRPRVYQAHAGILWAKQDKAY